MLFAGLSQILHLYDPLIFGWILDNYAVNPGEMTQEQRVNGVLWLLGLAIVVALAARKFSFFKDNVIQLIVRKFGMQIVNDGLRQTMRLPFHEFEDQSSGEILSILQKVRADTQKFISSFIDILFSSLVGIDFLVFS